jgi:hypothetical protein
MGSTNLETRPKALAHTAKGGKTVTKLSSLPTRASPNQTDNMTVIQTVHILPEPAAVAAEPIREERTVGELMRLSDAPPILATSWCRPKFQAQQTNAF